DQALAYARARGATSELVAALWMNGGVAWARGDLPGAEADARQALELVRLSRLWIGEAVLRAVLASLLVLRGELDAADAEIEATGITGPVADGFVFALVLAARGQLEEAVADLLELDRRSKGWGLIGAPAAPARISAARALAAIGERERARAKAEVALAHARRWGAPSLLSKALRTLAMTGDDAECVAAL